MSFYRLDDDETPRPRRRPRSLADLMAWDYSPTPGPPCPDHVTCPTHGEQPLLFGRLNICPVCMQEDADAEPDPVERERKQSFLRKQETP
jgi:hypothetical protein